MEYGYSTEIDTFVKKIVYKFSFERSERDDLLSEARIVALYAIRKFDSNRKVQLKTYLYRCIVNRLIDIGRTKKRGDRLSHLIQPETFSDTVNIENEIDVRKKLTREQYQVYQLIMSGHTLRDISKKFSQAKGISLSTALKEVDRCFTRILKRFKLPEMSPSPVDCFQPEPCYSNVGIAI